MMLLERKSTVQSILILALLFFASNVFGGGIGFYVETDKYIGPVSGYNEEVENQEVIKSYGTGGAPVDEIKDLLPQATYAVLKAPEFWGSTPMPAINSPWVFSRRVRAKRMMRATTSSCPAMRK